MKQVSRVRAIGVWLMLLAMTAGCASERPEPKPPPNDSSLCISGDPGTRFTVEYRSQGRWDRVTTTLTQRAPSVTIVEFWEGDLECDIRKLDKTSTLTATIYRDGRVMFVRVSPPGTLGLQITHFWAGWKAIQY
jgi:hypothetical protein